MFSDRDDNRLQPYERLLGLLLQSSGRIEERLYRLEMKVGSNEQADKLRDNKLMAGIQDVIDKATEAKTVSESTNIAVREVIRLLKEGQTDPAKIDEAIALLDAIKADDASMLTDNTPAAT